MKRDIHKLADWLVEVCQEGVSIESKILEWKLSEKTVPVNPQPKVG